MIAKKVSVIGTPKIIIGVIIATAVAFFKPCRDRTEIIKPIKRAPVSPPYIMAG